ncbi:MAG: hypothetical protein JW885_13850 [Deltaproteobacteria bacterium]|nr:hypothetical protein [Candidatus Zymogenaceae bacterium]
MKENSSHNTLQAAATVVDITPDIGSPLGGYLLRQGVSQGILDPIYARLLYVSNGSESVLLVSLDFIYVMGEWSDRCARTVGEAVGVEPGRVVVWAVHTHSGPGVFRSAPVGWEGDGEGRYLERVTEHITRAARGLPGKAVPAALRIGSAAVGNIGTHRNEPERAVDDELVFARFVDESGGTIARLVNYGCHPTALGPDNLLFSADFVGAGLSRLDAKGGVFLFLNGGSGDVSTRFTRRDTDRVGERDRFGEILAAAALAARENEKQISGRAVSIQKTAVTVAYRKYPDVEVARRAFDRAEEALARERGRGADPGRLRRLESVREGTLATLLLSGMGGPRAHFGDRSMDTAVSLVEIGGLLIVFFPGEVMSETALDLKKNSGMPLMVCGYAGDYFGYLARSSGDNSGGEDENGVEYESLMAVLDAESIHRLIDGAKRMVARSSETERKEREL